LILFVLKLSVFPLSYALEMDLEARVSELTKRVKNFSSSVSVAPAKGFPMRVSDGSMGDGAAEFHTTRRMLNAFVGIWFHGLSRPPAAISASQSPRISFSISAGIDTVRGISSRTTASGGHES
jgi:hypothetical protein